MWVDFIYDMIFNVNLGKLMLGCVEILSVYMVWVERKVVIELLDLFEMNFFVWLSEF